MVSVVSVSPENESEGQALLQPVEVTFSEAVDPDSVHSGTFVIYSKASKVLGTGPLIHSINGSELLDYNLLSSPTFQGVVEGSYSFNAGYTVATFTPSQPFEVNSEYIVILSAEVLSRTIGDVTIGYYQDLLGNGSLSVEGPYTGASSDTIIVQVQSSGSVESGGTFKYFYASDPSLTSDEIPLDYSVELFDGIILHFDTGTFQSGDSWAFDIIPGVELGESTDGAIYTWTFATGSGNLTTPPSETKSVDLSGFEVTGIATSSSDSLSYVEVSPSNEIPILSGWADFVFTFSKTLNTSYDPDDLEIYYTNIQSFTAKDRTQTTVDKTISVSGKTITVTIETDIPDNQEVHFNFSNLESQDGDSLDQEVEFLSNLDPLFITDDRIRIEVGPFIQSIPSQTIYRLIWANSQMADSFNFKEETSDFYLLIQGEWVTLRTICQLLTLAGSSGSNSSKSLGDFSVTAKAGSVNASDTQKDACKLAQDLLLAVKNGGSKFIKPETFIKSWNDPNRPVFGRGWFNQVANGELPAGNIRTLYYRRGYITGGDSASLMDGEDLH